MTTKTGDRTKASIIADANIDLVQRNKHLNFKNLKAIKTSEEYSPADATDWVATITTQDAALDEIAGRVKDIESDSVNIDELVTLTGVSAGAEDLGTFTGATIADSSDIKEALQALETASEAIAGDVGNLVTLSGVAVDSVNLGAFSGSTISDNVTIKAALQALETAHEASDSHLVATGTLTTGQILALNATPIELIAAPAGGSIIVVDQIELFLDFEAAAYVRNGGNEELVIQYATGGVDIHAFATATDTFLTSAADARRVIKPVIYDSAAVNFDPDTADAEAVVAFITNSEVITGDSPIKWKIRYHIETLLT